MRTMMVGLALALAVPLAAQQRPAADTARDADRKPDAMVAFAGIKPGQTVADMLPGGGYFTRIFATAVGAKGKVYAIIPAQQQTANPQRAQAIRDLATTGWPNVTVIDSPADPAIAGTLDLLWTSQNYHDLHNALPPEMVIGFNRQVFTALKKGGRYVVVDHAARDGSGLADTRTLHRIDPAVVKAEVTAAGFVFDGESDALRNPADGRDKPVFDPALRGHTDQFVYRFRKP